MKSDTIKQNKKYFGNFVQKLVEIKFQKLHFFSANFFEMFAPNVLICLLLEAIHIKLY